MPTPTPRYGIKTIAEQSVVAWFNENADMLPGVTIVAGQTSEVRSLPTAILYAESAESHPDFMAQPNGNFNISFKVYVYSSADDAATQEEAFALHRERVENVQAIMQDESGLMNSWSEGQLYHAYLQSDEEGVDGRRFGNVLTYQLTAVYPPA